MALSTLESQALLATLNSERFLDTAPAAVHAILLDEGRYLGSVRTMYRHLATSGGACERRNQRVHPAYAKPELLATGPNQVWSWDISKLKGPAKWTCFHLYVILDIYSRYVVGWMIADRECSILAKQLIGATAARHQIVPGTLTLHADRGTSMRSKTVAELLADLSITKSHSRPHVSDDNPYSEAHFKTLKYRPEFPDRFGSPEHARSCCGDLLHWYNTEHHHVGLGLFTPHDVHYGLAAAKREQRARVLADAFAKHPERFPNGLPSPRALPGAVWINPPADVIEVAENENTMTRKSRSIEIIDPGATSKAVPEVEPVASPSLTSEDRCMAVAQ